MKIFVNGMTRAALMLAMFSTATFAMVRSADATQGTIVSVQKSTVVTPETNTGNPTDNPLQTQYYRYDISVKVGDGLYVGRYDSAFDDLSDSLAPDHVVSIRLQKGVMSLDSQGDSLKTTIVSHKRDKSDNRVQAASMKADEKPMKNEAF
jgi:hypothetical protein